MSYISFDISDLRKIKNLLMSKDESKEIIAEDGDRKTIMRLNEDNRVSKIETYLKEKLHSFNNRPAIIEYDAYGLVAQEEWYENGIQHRDGKPAFIKFTGNKVICEKYIKNGLLHNEKAPAEVNYKTHYHGGSYTTKLYSESWYKNGQLHREGDNPAFIRYSNNYVDLPTLEMYYKNGVITRDKKPAKIDYNFRNCELIKNEYYYKDGQYHRGNDLPAVITRDDNGNIIKQEWYKNGLKHRDGNKPSYIAMRSNGGVECEKWCKNGIPARENNLANSVTYYSNGSVYEEAWLDENGMYKDLGGEPNLITYYSTGELSGKYLRKVGGTRYDSVKDLPAVVEFTKTGTLKKEEWYKDGTKHRDNFLPADIAYFVNGKKKHEKYYMNGKLSNYKGAAHITFTQTGEIKTETNYIDGEKIKDDFLYTVRAADVLRTYLDNNPEN